MSEMIEVGRGDLRVGDVIVSNGDASRTFVVETIGTGMSGYGWPYLTLRGNNGQRIEHDTSLDSLSATYTVRR